MSINRYLISGCCLAIGATLIIGLVTVFAADQRLDNMARNGHGYRASELIGLSVHTSGDQEKGKIKDLMVGPDGRVEYAAVSFGGFLGMGDKLFAVPMDAIHLDWKDNKINQAHVDVDENTLKQRQGFDENHWPDRADRGFTASEPGRVNR